MRRKIKTAAASFMCMCMLIASGCGNSGDSDVGGVTRRTEGGGGTTPTTQEATTGDIWSTQDTQAVPTTEATTGSIVDTPTTQEQQTTQTPTTEATTQTPTTEAATQTPTTEATTQQTSSGALQTKRIENDYYKVTIPDGWSFETWGAGAGFCFRCINPNDPSMVIFYAGTLTPVFTSEQQKTPYYSVPGAEVYTEAPVFNDQTVDSIYQNWEYIVNFQIKYQGFSLFPVMKNVTVQGSTVTNDMMHQFNTNFTDTFGYAYGTSENGTSVLSMCKASIGGDPMDLFAVGYDNSPRSIVCMYCIECPQDKSDLAETMMNCALSLEFTEKALQESQQSMGGGNGMGMGPIELTTEETMPFEVPTYDLPLPDGKTTVEYPD